MTPNPLEKFPFPDNIPSPTPDAANDHGESALKKDNVVRIDDYRPKQKEAAEPVREEDYSQIENPKELPIEDSEGLPRRIWGEDYSGSIALNHLRSARGVLFPKRFRGRLIMRSLESAKDFVPPEDFEGTLDLDGLASIDFLNLPRRFKGDVYLRNVSSLKGLYVPEDFEGTVFINAAIPVEELNTREIATQGRVQFVHSLGVKAPRKHETERKNTHIEAAEAFEKISGVLRKRFWSTIKETFNPKKK